MALLLKGEQVGLFAHSLYYFWLLQGLWWIYPVFFLAPDRGMIGYAFNAKAGALTYHLVHHQGICIAIPGAPWVTITGSIILGHSALDRLFGYGLKYPDAFNHTHLGKIGN
jgi:hypothetical protein